MSSISRAPDVCAAVAPLRAGEETWREAAERARIGAPPAERRRADDRRRLLEEERGVADPRDYPRPPPTAVRVHRYLREPQRRRRRRRRQRRQWPARLRRRRGALARRPTAAAAAPPPPPPGAGRRPAAAALPLGLVPRREWTTCKRRRQEAELAPRRRVGVGRPGLPRDGAQRAPLVPRRRRRRSSRTTSWGWRPRSLRSWRSCTRGRRRRRPPGWRPVARKILHVQTVDAAGRWQDPTICKLSPIDMLRAEADAHAVFARFIGESVPQRIGEPVYVENIGGMVLELVGACWRVPELAHHRPTSPTPSPRPAVTTEPRDPATSAPARARARRRRPPPPPPPSACSPPLRRRRLILIGVNVAGAARPPRVWRGPHRHRRVLLGQLNAVLMQSAHRADGRT